MAVNPLYRNEYYFFSGMYDDSLITDFYRMISSESFERSIHYQQNMLGRKRHLSNNDIFGILMSLLSVKGPYWYIPSKYIPPV